MRDRALFILFFLLIISIYLKNNINYYNKLQEFISTDANASLYLNTPDCIKVFSSIEKYSKMYDIPMKYALGIAYYETRYEGPTHWGYSADDKISSAGAIGAMQIMSSTANIIWNESISPEKLMSDIDFNIETSMKLLRILHDKYQNWKIVFGCYNTGKPLINDYSEKIYNFKRT